MKKVLIILLLISALGLIAAQDPTPTTFEWQDVFKMLILLIVAAFGAPITQLIKNLLKVEDRWALIITGVVAAILAVLQMWLAGILDFSTVTTENFPAMFFAVFSVATIYYAWLKNSPSVFGKGFLLK